MSKSKIGLILRGIGMGIAEVIPGVSGGTIAFITGIYSSLIESIKAVDLDLVRLVFRGKFSEVSKKLDLSFLFFLFSGMALGLLLGIFVVDHLLENSPELLWSAFFALILASIPFMIRSMDSLKTVHVIAMLFAVIMAYFITELSPVSANADPLYIFLGGAVAIVALVLPGISGSFILLLLGLYTLIIPTLKSFISSPSTDEFRILAFFSLGCITGLVFFSRIISAAFKKYNDMTVALMTGFMIGSLNKIWPWRNPTKVLLKDSSEFKAVGEHGIDLSHIPSETYKVVSETNVLPGDYISDPHLLAVIIVFLCSILSVVLISRFAKQI